MENVPEATANLAAEKAAALLKLFPECAGERGEVDFEKLKQTLADHVIEGDVERYQFTWPGKRAAMAEANVPTTKTLAPCEEESVDFAKTQNLYIEGDNLEVLKILRASYLGQVKMIYIDPPYNTGHDFVYHDRFAITQEEADQRGGNVDVLGRRFTENSESNPRYHSDWCSMMYPRLKLARDLLRDDGVIFISIDDNEVVNARKLCDAVFGEENFIATISCVNKPSGRSDDKYIATAHEYILICRKSQNVLLGGFDPEEQIIARYTKKDADGRLYRDEDLRKRGTNDERVNRPNLFYPFFFNQETGEIRIGSNEDETPRGFVRIVPMKTAQIEGSWRWGKETAVSDLKHLRAGFMENKGQWTMFEMQYLDERGDVKPTSVWAQKDVNSERGTESFVELGFNSRIFQNPKPVGTLYRIAKIATSTDSLILDFFSGSATTAHAVMQLNAEDGGHRKFILVQLPEVCAEGSEAAKAGYKNICEIGKERIRRAGKKIVEKYSPTESAEGAERREDDLFRVCAQPQTDSADSASSAGGRKTPTESAENTEMVQTRSADSAVSAGDKKTTLDIGFRVLKVVDSPMVDASKSAGETTQAELSFSSVKDGVKDDALLFHTMLRLGIAPTDTIEYKTIEGNKVACVGGVQLVAALDAQTQMTNAFIEAIAKMNPGVAVFRDDTFRNNNALRISLDQTFKQLSKETKIEVI